ncbi:hypothetical protein [Marinilactibacillus psychrotolerans]|uniref:hypothetical protein n=1 Tax=Marinilactibacillus psychrotolerans TaxID=191770 RepID=UPI0038177313
MKINSFEREIVTYGLFKVGVAVLGVLFLKMYTSFLSVEDIGVFNLALNFFTLVVSVIVGWIGLASLRLTDNHKDNFNSYLSTLIVTILAISVITLFLFSLILYFLGLNEEVYSIFVFLIIPFSFYEVFINVLRAQRRVLIFNASTH